MMGRKRTAQGDYVNSVTLPRLKTRTVYYYRLMKVGAAEESDSFRRAGFLKRIPLAGTTVVTDRQWMDTRGYTFTYQDTLFIMLDDQGNTPEDIGAALVLCRQKTDTAELLKKGTVYPELSFVEGGLSQEYSAAWIEVRRNYISVSRYDLENGSKEIEVIVR